MSQAMALDNGADWSEDALATIVSISIARYVFSADDLALEMGKPPHPNMVGAAFAAARTRGLIEAVGYQTSTNKSRRNGVIRTWRRKIEGVAA
jgi:hypothetical protein